MINFSGGYAWQDEVLSFAGGLGDGFELPSYGITNFAASYETGDWTVALFVDNLFDEFAQTGVRDNPLFDQVVQDEDGGDVNVRRFFTTVLPPRSVGVRFSYNFGDN